tara:strand:+ start:598 stop:1467 length:870 start_codon:yes stop_codon:yes gene_type:complete
MFTKIEKKLKLYFFWITLERFPNLYRPSSKPYLSGDSLRKISDHVFDETKTFNPINVSKKDIVFLSGNLIDKYFLYFHPKINVEYILITHNSDKNITDHEYSYVDKNIIHWFAQNLEVNNREKISIIPIGVENLRRLKFGRKKWFKNSSIKTNDILFSFNLYTNYLKRQPAFEALHKNLNFEIYSNTEEYFENLKKTKFVISPEGNGSDTHRIWEALIVNTLPIMIKTSFTKNLQDLGVPGIYLNSWEELLNYDKNELNEIYVEETNKKFLYLTQLEYWEDKIKNYKVI